MRCINKEPKARPTANELVRELESVIDKMIVIVWEEYEVE
jgi:hypothetical protein